MSERTEIKHKNHELNKKDKLVRTNADIPQGREYQE